LTPPSCKKATGRYNGGELTDHRFGGGNWLIVVTLVGRWLLATASAGS
jgi:hypothetical protein